MSKKYWEDTQEYQRILEILNDYWLEEKDEEEVEVEMYFRHKNGEWQSKLIGWQNPEWKNERPWDVRSVEELFECSQEGKLYKYGEKKKRKYGDPGLLLKNGFVWEYRGDEKYSSYLLYDLKLTEGQMEYYNLDFIGVVMVGDTEDE